MCRIDIENRERRDAGLIIPPRAELVLRRCHFGEALSIAPR